MMALPALGSRVRLSLAGTSRLGTVRYAGGVHFSAHELLGVALGASIVVTCRPKQDAELR